MPETVALGPLLLSTRVAAFVVAFLLARWIASRLTARFELDAAWTQNTVDGSVLFGLIAARLANVALYWEAYAPEPWTVLYLWLPGYVPVAGLAGGALFVLYRLRNHAAAARLSYFRAIGTGLAAGAIVVAASLFTMNMLADPGVLRAGDRIPDFELVDLDGERVAYSDLEGKGIVLNFWATWCAPCRREMPLLDAAWNEYRSKNVVVVGIDFGEPADVVRRFVDSGGFRYPIWLDPDPKDDDAAETTEMLGWFGAAGLPTTVFIRPDGIIDSIHLGEVNRALLLERLPAIVPE